MAGIFIYFIFLLIGYVYACFIYHKYDIWFRIWMGGVFGNVLLMAGAALTSVLFDFTHMSHMVLLGICIVPAITIIRKHKFSIFKNISGTKSGIDRNVFLFLILPLTILVGALLTNHILTPTQSGGVASGQSTYGDLQMHLGFITSIARQKAFPPAYAFLDGHMLNYPFFADMLSSSLYLFGTSLRLAVLIPSFVICGLLVMGFFIIAYRISGRKSAAVLASVLFFLGSGFGFGYFLDGAKANPQAFTSIFNDYYRTPTNLTDHNLRWVNPICDMIIPQRTTMAGWCVFFPALWMLLEAIKNNSKKNFIILAVTAGCMPMIHTHSFLALGIISACLFFLNLKNKKEYFINWVLYGAVVFVLAAPQLFFWTFRQTANNQSFLRWSFNWVNKSDPYLWFYIKNWGIIALFAVPAAMYASKDNKKLLAAAGVIMLIAELIVFQPNEYDNNKLIFIAYMILTIGVSGWLLNIWDMLQGAKGRGYLAVMVIAFGTVSGVLTIIREYKSGGDYETFTKNQIEIGEYIKSNIPSDALFLTSDNHLNPVVTLAGNNIYVGSSLYVYFHGMGNKYYKRTEEITKAYGGTYEELSGFCKKHDIDYIYIGKNEKNQYSIKDETVAQLNKVCAVGTEAIYKVSK